MIDIVEHLKKYPIIRLPSGHRYDISSVEVHKLRDSFKEVVSVAIGRIWVTFPNEVCISWKDLRRTRRDIAIRSVYKWSLR